MILAVVLTAGSCKHTANTHFTFIGDVAFEGFFFLGREVRKCQRDLDLLGFVASKEVIAHDGCLGRGIEQVQRPNNGRLARTVPAYEPGLIAELYRCLANGSKIANLSALEPHANCPSETNPRILKGALYSAHR